MSPDPAPLWADLDRVRAWLEAHNPVVAGRLRPGLSEAEVAAKTAGLPGHLPGEVAALYRWRDGVAGDDFPPLVWYHWLMPLDVAAAEYRQLVAAAGIELWDPRWFPLFTFMGEYYFVTAGPAPAAAGPVGHLTEDGTPTPGVFPSLAAMIRTAAEWYEAGAVWVADPATGALADNIAEVAAIHARLNPGCPFPYHVPG